MSFDPAFAFIRCVRGCDTRDLPVAIGRGRYVCECCGHEFDSGIRPGASRVDAAPPSRRRAAPAELLEAQ